MTKFLVDRMLGQTAKWLRLMGIDAEYAPKCDDSKLKELAKNEDRVILTRDRELSNHEKALYIGERDIDDILNKVLKEFELEIKPLTRCSLCNAEIISVEKESVEGKVPEGVYERNNVFWICKNCDQIYWKGTHWDKILAKIEKLSK
ncbi:MAG: Mut7-C RNAse domain-containing protein [Thermoplasmatota archaeon]